MVNNNLAKHPRPRDGLKFTYKKKHFLVRVGITVCFCLNYNLLFLPKSDLQQGSPSFKRKTGFT
jgi:hypothetical protein